jgi:hypothetical protein
MDMLGALLGAQSGNAARQLGQQFGLDESQASSALAALLPALAAGVKSNAAGGGLDGLLASLAGSGATRYAEDLGALGAPQAVDDGNGILGQIFGSKEVSRQVAQRASAQSGVSPDLLKQMLPVVAALVMGGLAKQRMGGGTGVPIGTQLGASGGGGLMDALAPMLDANKDGSIADDVMGMLGKFMGGR